MWKSELYFLKFPIDICARKNGSSIKPRNFRTALRNSVSWLVDITKTDFTLPGFAKRIAFVQQEKDVLRYKTKFLKGPSQRRSMSQVEKWQRQVCWKIKGRRRYDQESSLSLKDNDWNHSHCCKPSGTANGHAIWPGFRAFFIHPAPGKYENMRACGAQLDA